MRLVDVFIHQLSCRLDELGINKQQRAAWLADLGFSRQLWYRWRDGNLPGLPAIERVSQALGCTVADLLSDPTGGDTKEIHKLYDSLTDEDQAVIARLIRLMRRSNAGTGA